jgi:hypothetical protein
MISLLLTAIAPTASGGKRPERHLPFTARSSAPTGFTILAGSSNQFLTLGASLVPIAGYRFNLNAPSSVGASATLIMNQAGVG